MDATSQRNHAPVSVLVSQQNGVDPLELVNDRHWAVACAPSALTQSRRVVGRGFRPIRPEEPAPIELTNRSDAPPATIGRVRRGRTAGTRAATNVSDRSTQPAGHPGVRADAVTDAARSQVHQALRAAARSVLADIDAALRRIEQGSYGRCQECGDALTVTRLTALPMAARCGSCQRVRETHCLQPDPSWPPRDTARPSGASGAPGSTASWRRAGHHEARSRTGLEVEHGRDRPRVGPRSVRDTGVAGLVGCGGRPRRPRPRPRGHAQRPGAGPATSRDPAGTRPAPTTSTRCPPRPNRRSPATRMSSAGSVPTSAGTRR